MLILVKPSDKVFMLGSGFNMLIMIHLQLVSHTDYTVFLTCFYPQCHQLLPYKVNPIPRREGSFTGDSEGYATLRLWAQVSFSTGAPLFGEHGRILLSWGL